jgi:hypothetical protein
MTSLCTWGINSLDEVRVAGEGLECGRPIASEEMGEVVLWHIQIGKLEPRQRTSPRRGSAMPAALGETHHRG